jgi:hypothetical protein
MKLSKEAKTAVILALDKFCEGRYDYYGLPVYEEIADMRELIDETLANFPE